jgi:transcriptional regulator with XRE-family HTH domain
MTISNVERKRLKYFGEVIRQFRKTRGLSQEALGFAAGLDRTYVGGVERGERNLTLLKIFRICKALDTSPVVIFQECRKKENG